MSHFQFWSSMAERREEKRREADLRCQTRCSPQAAGRISARGQEARKSKRACKLSCSPAPSKASWTWQGCRSGVSWRTVGGQKTKQHPKKKKKSEVRPTREQSQRRDTRNTEGITSVRWPGSSPWLLQGGSGRIKSWVWDSLSLPLSLSSEGIFCRVLWSEAVPTSAAINGPMHGWMVQNPGMAMTVKRQGTTSCPLVHNRVPLLKGPWKWLRVDGALCHGLHTY